MTLGEAKSRTLQLLDEYSSGGEVSADADLTLRLTALLDAGTVELSRKRPLLRTVTLRSHTDGSPAALPGDGSRLRRLLRGGRDVTHRFARAGNLVYLPANTGSYTAEYLAVPEAIPEDAPESYELPLDREAAALLPLYAAGMLALGDPSVDGASLLGLYRTALQALPEGPEGKGGRISQSFFGR